MGNRGQLLVTALTPAVIVFAVVAVAPDADAADMACVIRTEGRGEIVISKRADETSPRRDKRTGTYFPLADCQDVRVESGMARVYLNGGRDRLPREVLVRAGERVPLADERVPLADAEGDGRWSSFVGAFARLLRVDEKPVDAMSRSLGRGADIGLPYGRILLPSSPITVNSADVAAVKSIQIVLASGTRPVVYQRAVVGGRLELPLQILAPGFDYMWIVDTGDATSNGTFSIVSRAETESITKAAPATAFERALFFQSRRLEFDAVQTLRMLLPPTP